MKIRNLLLVISLMTPSIESHSDDGWILDGERLCSFDEGINVATRCTQYHQVIERVLSNGQILREYRWKWTSGYNEIVYSPSLGVPGISQFTIGSITTYRRGILVRNREKAASYSLNREEIIIGIPGDGYSFSMKGSL